MLFIGDPEVVQDMLVAKNAILDKTGLMAGMFTNFFGNSFLFSKTDARWREKRKGAAHAFYKDKLVVMIEQTLKSHIKQLQCQWFEAIKKSDDSSMNINMSKEFLRIF